MKRSDVLAVLGLTVGYPLLAHLAHAIGPVGRFTTPIWPAAGLALAILLLAGSRLWPALLFGATASQLVIGIHPLSALLIGAGATLECVAAAWLVRRFAGGAQAFRHLRSVLAFLLLAGILTPVVGATFALFGLGVPPEGTMMSLGRLWLVRWLSSSAGIMLVTPLVVLWATDRRRTWSGPEVFERGLLGVALIGACEVVFGVPFRITQGNALTFLFSPILAWAAFRLRIRATALAVFITAAAAVWGTARGTSPFLRDDVMAALQLLQIFSILMSGSAFAIAAAMRELRRARYQAARSEERARFLADASRLLSSSLNMNQTLPALASLAVPRIADWSAVHLVDSGGAIREIAVAHIDPRKIEEVRRLFADYAHDPETPRGSRKVIRTGEPDLATEIPDSMLSESARSPEQLAMLRSLGFTSYVCVPMRAGRRVLGAITLVSTRPERRYDHTDVDQAQELADRAAIAIENARLYAHVQEAVRIREDFLAIASHELRTPLTALRLQITLLERALRGGTERPPATIPQMVQKLNEQGQRLTALVNRLFDVTAITAGKLDLTVRDTDFKSIVETAVHSLEPLAREHGVRLTLEAPQPVPGRWDATRITQVVANLVGNAIKYGGGKPVDVRVATEDSVVKLSVCDHGPGIPEEHRRRIFERFERLPSKDGPEPGGLGLGLYIVRQIVHAHGGTVDVGTHADGGAVFTVTLPRWTSRRREGELHEATAHR